MPVGPPNERMAQSPAATFAQTDCGTLTVAEPGNGNGNGEPPGDGRSLVVPIAIVAGALGLALLGGGGEAA